MAAVKTWEEPALALHAEGPAGLARGDLPNCGLSQEPQQTDSVSRSGFQPIIWQLPSPSGSGEELLVFREARMWMAFDMKQVPDHSKLGF